MEFSSITLFFLVFIKKYDIIGLKEKGELLWIKIDGLKDFCLLLFLAL